MVCLLDKNQSMFIRSCQQKMFKIGISFGWNDLNLEGHLQMGYNSKTIKYYNKLFEAQTVHAQLTQDKPSNPNGEE